MRLALAVALVTLASSLAWGLVVPPLQVPDEPAHLFYAQYLGETGNLPRPSPDVDWYSADVNGLIYAERLYDVVGNSAERPATDATAARMLDEGQRERDRTGVGDASSATSNPPLYYLPQAGVYRLVHGLDVTDRLAAMRLVSSLLAALTAMCAFLFVREMLPGSPIASLAGGLAAGLQPVFGFVSSGVTNDAGLYLMSAALLLAIARVLRRGLTPGRAAAVGGVFAAGVLVKTQVLAFAPGVALALLVAALRVRDGWAPWRSLAAAAGAAAAPLAAYGILGATVWDRPVLDRVAEVGGNGSGAAAGRPWLFSEFLSYTWQLYLPRLPFMTDLHPEVPVYHLWFKGLVGRFGWLDYGFPSWVYLAVLAGLGGLIALAAALLVQRRRRLRERIWETLTFGLMTAGLLGAIAVVGYQARVDGAPGFEQARYLLPLLPLYALLVGLAVRGARRAAPVVAVLVVACSAALSLFGQLVTIGRFYG